MVDQILGYRCRGRPSETLSLASLWVVSYSSKEICAPVPIDRLDFPRLCLLGMVLVHGPKDRNLDFESLRPLEMSLVLPHQDGTSLEVQRSPLGALAKESLAEIAPFT